MEKIKIRELTETNAKCYGSFTQLTGNNQISENQDHYYSKVLSEAELGENLQTALLGAKKREMVINKMEVHWETPETLIALKGDSIICLAETNSKGKCDDFIPFYFKEGSVLNMKPGIWHWLPYPDNCNEAWFLVVFKEKTEIQDIFFEDLAKDYQLIREDVE